MSYRHLTLEQRYQIAALQRAGVSQQHSAQETGCHSSTVSRALRRNCSGKIYVGSIGHGQAKQRRHAASSHAHLSDAVRLELIARLKQDHSPDQIRGRLKLPKGGVASHTTVYRYARQLGLRHPKRRSTYKQLVWRRAFLCGSLLAGS